jgi:hypothetical protein
VGRPRRLPRFHDFSRRLRAQTIPGIASRGPALQALMDAAREAAGVRVLTVPEREGGMGPGSSETRVRSTPSGHPLDAGGFAPGTILVDRYRIVSLAGRGGMGEVYRADDLNLGQTVALKFLPASLERDGAAGTFALAVSRRSWRSPPRRSAALPIIQRASCEGGRIPPAPASASRRSAPASPSRVSDQP